MRFIPLRHRSFQLIVLILSFYMVHAHYSELDALYALILSQAFELKIVLLRDIAVGHGIVS